MERGLSLQHNAVFFAPVEVRFLPLVGRADAELDATFASHKSQRGTTIAEDVGQKPKTNCMKSFVLTRALK